MTMNQQWFRIGNSLVPGPVLTKVSNAIGHHLATMSELISPWREWLLYRQTTFSNTFLLNEKVQILIKISLKLVPKGIIDHNQALV